MISSTTADGESFRALLMHNAISFASINLSCGKSTPFQDADQVAPGNIDVTLIFLSLSSSLNTLEKPSSANLEMLYEPPLGKAIMLATEHILKICPDPRLIIPGITFRER